jgi:predicted ATPase
VQEVSGCVAQSRLVTLTGTGGIGKTRLALQVAEELAPEFEDHVCFVNLAPLAAPERVPDAVQTALGVAVGAAREEPLALLQQYLAPRGLLLVLDNCEHLLSACANLAEALLGQCAGLRILATSRQPLGIWGETIWRVPSLPVPADAGSQATDGNAFPSVQLFVERARAAVSSFELTPRNAAAVAEVCRRLDGLPLALELAAARVGAMPVEQIARRLGDGYGLLAGGAAALPRHQTLAATIEWSWSLLTAPEQILLRRLSVFAGGCTLEMAEAVTGDGAPGGRTGPESIAVGDVLGLIVSLVDKSLVVYEDQAGEARYQLLETVRHYAGDRLRGSDDWEATQNRHRDVLLEWAEELKTRLWGPEQGEGFRRLEAEHDNLRAALAWSRSRGDAEKELRLVVALSRFWDTHGHLREGRAHLDAALERMTPDLPVSLQVAALVHAGWMAYTEGDYPTAHRHYERTLILAREQRNPSTMADALNYLALVLVEEGDFGAARSFFEESLAVCREHDLRAWSVLSNLGNLALRQADYEAARSYLEQSAAGCRALGIVQEHGLVLHDLSVVALQQGRYDEARAHGTASLGLLHACGAVINLPAVLTQMALVARWATQWERTARLLGAAEALRAAVGGSAPHAAPRAEAVAAAELALGQDAFTAAYAAGHSLDLDQAIAEASG